MNSLLRFIIIGEVPGTAIQLSFVETLLVCLCLSLSAYLVYARFSKRKYDKIDVLKKSDLSSKTI